MSEPKVGDIVEVVFLDHAMDSSEGVLLCRCVGRLDAFTDESLTVRSWWSSDVYDPVNDTRYDLVRGAVRRLTVLGAADHSLCPSDT